MDIIYTFPNTSAVIAAEQLLLFAKIPVKVRPIPNAIRAGCGLSLCVSPDDKSAADKKLKDGGIEVSEIYESQDGKFTLIK